MKKNTPPKYALSKRTLRYLSEKDYFNFMFESPPYAKDLILECECGNKFRPPWEKPLGFEYAPIQSQDGAVWAPSGISVPCPRCSSNIEFEFPHIEDTGHRCEMYGDEAYEWKSLDSLLVYVFAFITLTPPAFSRIQHAIQMAKARIRPNVNPDEWAFHVSDLRDERWRRVKQISMSIIDINAEIRNICKVLSISQEERSIHVILSTYSRNKDKFTKGKFLDIVAKSTLYAGMMTITDFMTKQGHSVKFTLEAQTLAHLKNEIDFNVELVSRSLRKNLSFLFVSRGQFVGLAETVSKGHTIELEIADIVAYSVKRYIVSKIERRDVLFDPALFGSINWTYVASERVGYHSATGFPYRYFSEKIDVPGTFDEY